MAFELRSSEIECKFIQERINSVEYLMAELCTVFSSYNRKSAQQRDSGDRLAKIILKLASKEVLNPSLRTALGRFSDIIHAIQDYREAEVQRVDHRVILEFASYDQICKQAKEQLKKSFSTRAKELTKQVQLEKIRAKKPTNWQQINQAEREADRARADAAQATLQLSQEVDSFEKKKLDDIKRVLLDFINIQLMFHAKALELYTKAYQIIDGIKPSDDLQIFRSHFSFPPLVQGTEGIYPTVGCRETSGDASKTLMCTPSKLYPSALVKNKAALLEGNLEDHHLSPLPSIPEHAVSISSSDFSDCSSSTVSGSNSEGRKTFKLFNKIFQSQSKKGF